MDNEISQPREVFRLDLASHYLQVWLESLDTHEQVVAAPLETMPPMLPTQGVASAPASHSAKKRKRSFATSSDMDETGAPGSSRSSVTRSLMDLLYRGRNLRDNNVFLRSSTEPFPDSISKLLVTVKAERNGSPQPSLADAKEYVVALEELDDNSIPESGVQSFFERHVFPCRDRKSVLELSISQPMIRQVVPDTREGFKVSTPKPDLMYGYGYSTAFTVKQQRQLDVLGGQMLANGSNVAYPFLVVEVKSDAGQMRVATNQCLGDSASCVKIAQELNNELWRHGETGAKCLIVGATFSIATNNAEARLYVSWYSEHQYHMQKVSVYHLHDEQQFLVFRRHVQNIIDWGRDTRLKQIRDAIDFLHKQAGERKAMPPPAPFPSPESSAQANDHRMSKDSSVNDSTSLGAGTGQ